MTFTTAMYCDYYCNLQLLFMDNYSHELALIKAKIIVKAELLANSYPLFTLSLKLMVGHHVITNIVLWRFFVWGSYFHLKIHEEVSLLQISHKQNNILS